MVLHFLHREAKIGDDLLKRNATVVLQPLARLLDGALFLFTHRFIVNRRVRQRATYRIEHRFEQPTNGRDLCIGQMIEISVGLPAFLAWIGFHANIIAKRPGAPASLLYSSGGSCSVAAACIPVATSGMIPKPT